MNADRGTWGGVLLGDNYAWKTIDIKTVFGDIKLYDKTLIDAIKYTILDITNDRAKYSSHVPVGGFE